jgi:hypothetical protein
MSIELFIAGVISVALAIGHTTIGVVWILPHLTDDQLPRTPFGPSSMSVSMIRVSWFIITIFALASGGLLINLSLETGADPQMLLLRWFAAMWLAAAVMAVTIALRKTRSIRSLQRLPVPMLWVVIAVLCWIAST